MILGLWKMIRFRKSRETRTEAKQKSNFYERYLQGVLLTREYVIKCMVGQYRILIICRDYLYIKGPCTTLGVPHELGRSEIWKSKI